MTSMSTNTDSRLKAATVASCTNTGRHGICGLRSIREKAELPAVAARSPPGEPTLNPRVRLEVAKRRKELRRSTIGSHALQSQTWRFATAGSWQAAVRPLFPTALRSGWSPSCRTVSCGRCFCTQFFFVCWSCRRPMRAGGCSKVGLGAGAGAGAGPAAQDHQCSCSKRSIA